MSLALFLGCGCALGGLLGGVVWLLEKPAPADSVTSPVVQVGWKIALLPITLPPQTSADVLLLRPDKILDLQNVFNNQDKSWQWPVKGKIWPPEQILVFKFENQDKVGLFNLAIPLSVNFQVGENPPKTVASAEITYKVESLLAGHSIKLYALNLSEYTVDIPMPTTAKLTVEASRDRIGISLTPHGILAEIGPDFENAVLPLLPTQHRWVGTKPEPKAK